MQIIEWVLMCESIITFNGCVKPPNATIVQDVGHANLLTV